MTRQEIASALELLHGMGMSYVEVASLCGCTVRELEQLSVKIMTFRSSHRNAHTDVLVRESDLDDITKINDSPNY